MPQSFSVQICRIRVSTCLRGSLREFGFINPVIIDKNCGILAGHGRVAAAKAEGMKSVPEAHGVFADEQLLSGALSEGLFKARIQHPRRCVRRTSHTAEPQAL